MCDNCGQAIKVKFCRLIEQAQIPIFGDGKSDPRFTAGVDLYAAERITLDGGSSRAVTTGIGWEVSNPRKDKKYVMIVQSRSGMAFKKNIEASNAGVVDQDYRGQIKVMLYNNSGRMETIHIGDRIAQGLIFEMPLVEIESVDELSDSKRGKDGFGSTGLK